jgi:hypothetical protein
MLNGLASNWLIVAALAFFALTVVLAARSKSSLFLFLQVWLIGLAMGAVLLLTVWLVPPQPMEITMAWFIHGWYAWLVNAGTALFIVLWRRVVIWVSAEWH